jgi:kinesin family protein 6/9
MLPSHTGWQVFRQLVLESRAAGRQHAQAADGASAPAGTSSAADDGGGSGSSDASQARGLQEHVRKLRLQVQQRDNEIGLLLNMLRGGSGSSSVLSSATSGQAAGSAGSSLKLSLAPSEAADSSVTKDSDAEQPCSSSSGRAADPPVLSALLDASLLSDRHAAFEVFRKSYKHGEVRGAWLARGQTPARTGHCLLPRHSSTGD